MAFKDVVATSSMIIAVGCAVIVSAGVAKRLFGTGAGERDTAALAEPVEDWAGLLETGHSRGAARPAVTIVEFADFQCPGCRYFALSAVKGILAHYPDKVRIVFHHLPLEQIHSLAYPAARATECAGRQGRFDTYHDLLFASQDSIGRKRFSEFAVDAEVPDTLAFASCLREKGRVTTIDADIRAATRLHARATPTVAINGALYAMYPDSARLDRIVQSEIRKASGVVSH